MDLPTALYTDLDIEYQNEYSGPYTDLSFASDECVVIAGIKDNEITGFGRPVIMAGDETLQKLHAERLYDTCSNIKYMDFLENGLSQVSQFLLRQGYKATPCYTQIIDLQRPEEQLRSEIRKSYKSLINKGLREYNLSFGINLTLFKDLHKEVVGRQTRPDSTWKIQEKMIRKGDAFEIQMFNDRLVAAGLFYTKGDYVYYGVGKSLVNIDSHALIWKAMLYAKSQGRKYFEMGNQVYCGKHKLVNISKFKRGFGGRTYVRLLLERE